MLPSPPNGVLLFRFVGVSACEEVVVVSFDVPVVEFNTETSPLMAGIANSRAVNIKTAAAPIVILDKTDCVPRGPNAVLEMLLVKSAPASALPGCSKTVATSTTHERKKII